MVDIKVKYIFEEKFYIISSKVLLFLMMTEKSDKDTGDNEKVGRNFQKLLNMKCLACI